MTLEENGLAMAQNFCVLGIPTAFVKGKATPLGFTFLFNLKNMKDYKESVLKDCIKKQAVYYHAEMNFVKTNEAHFGVFVKPQNTPTLSLAKVLKDCNLERMVLGIDSNGNEVVINFDKTPHLLIGGTTGSGKTNLIKNLVMNIVGYYGKSGRKAIINIIDTKYELKYLAQMSCVNHYGESIKTLSKESAYACLGGACRIMDKRYKGIYKNDYDIFIIIDELADLMLTTGMRGEVEDMIIRLASKGRACGIKLIIATQSPRVSVVSGLIKSNMPDRIVLKTASKRESIVMLEHMGAEQLRGNGDCIYKQGLNEIYAQIAYAEPQLIDKVIEINKG